MPAKVALINFRMIEIRKRGIYRTMNKKITMSMIARECDTSIGTVDRALNGRPGINPQTKEQILSTAKRLGYKPNQLAGALSRKKEYRIAIIYCKEHIDFYKYVTQGIEKAVIELENYGVFVDLFQTRSLSIQEQSDLLSSIDISKYDGFAINSAGTETDVFINHFIDRGKAVITFNTDAPATRRLFFVGANPRHAGNLGGELVGKMTGGKGKVAALGSFLMTNAFIERFIGFYEVIQKEYPGITLCPFKECYDSEQSAKRETIKIIEEHPDIQMLYLTGCAGTAGAIEALKELGRKDIRLIGYDLSNHIADAIREGWCTAILFQDPYQQGYYAASLLARHLIEGWMPKQPLLTIESRIMMYYNLEEYGNKNFIDSIT